MMRGDWKYRTVAINYDPNTKLLMQKTQGLGPKETVPHTNRSEYIWFTTDDKNSQHINFDGGVWLETRYANNTDISNQCLWIKAGEVLSAKTNSTECPTNQSAYKNNVTKQHGDMWWLSPNNAQASLAPAQCPPSQMVRRSIKYALHQLGVFTERNKLGSRCTLPLTTKHCY